jgi:hypothetical protein
MRPTRKEITAGTEMAMQLMGVDKEALDAPLAVDDQVMTPNGQGRVHKLHGRLLVTVEHEYSYLVDYSRVKARGVLITGPSTYPNNGVVVKNLVDYSRAKVRRIPHGVVPGDRDPAAADDGAGGCHDHGRYAEGDPAAGERPGHREVSPLADS